MAKVTVKGLVEHREHMKRRQERMKENVTKAVYVWAGAVEDTARLSILIGGIAPPNHIVSSPGEPPNAEYHNLDRSIRIRLRGQGADIEMTGDFGNEAGVDTRFILDIVAGGFSDTGVNYAAKLEWGNSEVAARPFMHPASEKEKQAGLNGVKTAIAKTMKE